MRLRPYSFCLGVALLAPCACSDTPTTPAAVVRPQLVAVTPADFMGSIRCAPPLLGHAGAGGAGGAGGATSYSDTDIRSELQLDPGAARTYVATLFDVTPAADGGVPNPGTALASSPPTSCVVPVTFSYVVDRHYYLAEVDAYHERPEELTPISAGSRLLSHADGTRAVPRWEATCGGYPPTVESDAGSAGAAGAGADEDTRPPGVVSYVDLTRTPHDCGVGLHESKPEAD